MDHSPHDETARRAIKNSHQTPKKRNVRASSGYAKKAQPAHGGCSVDAQRDQCAELQKHADQDRGLVRLKKCRYDVGWFPGTWPVWRFDAEWRAEHANSAKSGIEQNRIDYRQHSEVWAGVPDSTRNGIWLRGHGNFRDFILL